MENLLYWIWLSLATTAGTDTFSKLILKFGAPEAVYRAGKEDIISCIGSRSRDYNAVTDKDTERAQKILNFCKSKSVGILTYSDPRFPKALKEIKNPPVLLYYRGILPDFNSECFISVVGTRRLSDYGRRNAFSIGRDLAKAGALIVSGMATGIDGVAMAGALSAGGRTVAFLGSGIDVCYPDQHKRLAREIVKNGCVMTEYAPGTRPEKYNFPRRNRLISGIGAATIVVEGIARSGAIITARCAKEQGKSVYALPGNVDNKTSEVSNLLIQNGAKLIMSAHDIVHDFEYVYLGKLNPFNLEKDEGVRMFDVLRELEISCVTPSDKIFTPSRSKRVEREDIKRSEKGGVDGGAKADAVEPLPSVAEEPSESFDKQALKIYKKIPAEGECTIESLTDAEHNMRDVMRALLKLEMGKFVLMIPGEKVKRNLK